MPKEYACGVVVRANGEDLIVVLWAAAMVYGGVLSHVGRPS